MAEALKRKIARVLICVTLNGGTSDSHVLRNCSNMMHLQSYRFTHNNRITLAVILHQPNCHSTWTVIGCYNNQISQSQSDILFIEQLIINVKLCQKVSSKRNLHELVAAHRLRAPFTHPTAHNIKPK